jgi:hypothetical protein
MTYAQIAARLGVSGEAARQLVRRRGWHRIVPNLPGATTIVIVPEDGLAGLPGRDTQTPDIGDMRARPEGAMGDTRTPDAAAFETALAAIEAAHAAELTGLRERLDAAESGRLGAQGLADALAAQLADAGERANRAVVLLADVEARIKVADGDRRAAEGRVDRLEQDLAAARIIAQAAQRVAQEEVEQARAAAREAQEAAEALRQAAEARKARGRWARLRAAWRGQ